jgi:hypothetical protein
MDFKDRHLKLKRLPFWVLENQKRIFPYNCLLIGGLNEFQAFDRSTTFLLMHDSVPEAEMYWRAYAIEAPMEWVVRKKFERGDITWSDFFRSRGWLMELTGELYESSDPHCRYIKFSDLSSRVRERLEELDASGGPYQVLHDHLLDYWAALIKFGHDPSEYQKRYESLIRHHGHMLTKNRVA